MDKPTTPSGSNSSPWPEDSGSDQGFGATGVFQVVKAAAPAEKPDGFGLESFFQDYRAPEAPPSPPPPAPMPLTEPVVHKVVLGSGAETSPELLDRMRLASSDRAPLAEKNPQSAAAGKGGGGFTELLRTLEGDLNSPESAPAQGLSATPPSAPSPAPPAPGGFTQLLQTTIGADSTSSAPPIQRPADAPSYLPAAGSAPPPAENKPGAFTQLFGAFGSGEPSAQAPPPSNRATGDSARGNAGSFTRMLSLEPQSPATEPVFPEERKPLPGSVDYGHTPGMGSPAAPVRDPFAPAPITEAKPVESAPTGGSVGITRLIQMLDEPQKPSAPRFERAPASNPRGQEPGAWTQTFASLSTPSEPAPPAPRAPGWPPPSPVSPIPTGREGQLPASLNAPVVHAAAPAGPSEFTRILDASRMRELNMRGGSAAPGIPQTPQAPPPPAMPSFQPPAPPMGGMQGMGGMPHPGAYPPPPPQAPSYPMSYAPQAPAMPAPGGSLPQAPGMYAPAPPPMPAPAPPPLTKPPDPGMGKLQQLVPLLLVVVIVLLVVLIVTVIFLMKH